MNDRKLYLYVLKKDIPFDFLFVVMLSFLSFFCSCLVMDLSRFDGLPSDELAIFEKLGLSGITIQSYVFPFVVICLLLLAMSFLFSSLRISSYLHNLFLLSMKGGRNLKLRLSFFHFLKGILLLFLSLSVYALIEGIMNALFPVSVKIFVFEPLVFLSLTVFLFLDEIIYVLFLRRSMFYQRMLSYLREKY